MAISTPFEVIARRSARVTRFYRWLCFDGVAVPQALPPGQSVVLAAHYNGLLDGFVYMALSSGMLGVMSSQWHRTALGRLLLPGVTLTRGKDRKTGDSAGSNAAAFKAMLAAVDSGQALLYFPEGTSRLGTERLPVQRGTELLLRRLRAELPDVPVYFAAAHYDAPTQWRSRVALALDGPFEVPAEKDGLADWVTTGLLRAQDKALLQRFAPRSRCRLHLRRGLARVLMLPVAPSWLTARWAIHRCADDTNVISLWRILGGVPMAVLCWFLWALVALVSGRPGAALLAPLVSLMGVALWQS